MPNFIKENIFIIKFISSSFLCFLVFISFRIELIYNFNIKLLISFLLIQLIIWSILLISKRNLYAVILYNLFFIILLNFFLTPSFHVITSDIPVRPANFSLTKEYEGNFFNGMLSGKNIISYDEKGFRVNQKIDYKKKLKKNIRIITIGASTTEEFEKGNNKTWPHLLGVKIKKKINKNIEIINTGLSGLRLEHHYLTFNRIKKYEPDFVIFMFGINDWNHHILNSDINYLFPSYEIKYNFKKSILFNTFGNIIKQISKKIINEKKLQANENINSHNFEYLFEGSNSLNTRKIFKKFRPVNVSQDYIYWLNLLVEECKSQKPTCIFLDQPTAYKKNISNQLKRRLWMTPPFQEYTVSLEDLIYLSEMYNSWLKQKVTINKLNFVTISDQIEPNTRHLFDDCHFTENGSEKLSDILTSYINKNFNLISN